MRLITENEKGKTYYANGFKVLYRKARSVSGDNDTNVEESISIVCGTANVTIEKGTIRYIAPDSFTIPANTYHRIEAVTDIVLILVESARQDNKVS